MIRLHPTTVIDEKTTGVTVGWPPPGFDGAHRPVSPEEEGKGIFAALAAERDVDDNRALRLDWAEPFDLLFPTGGGRDLLYGWECMHRCVAAWCQDQRAQALHEVTLWVNKLTGQASSPLGKAWFEPKVSANPEGALYDVYGKFGLDFATVDDARQSASLQAKLRQTVPVVRAQSWLGYFWWELYQDFQAYSFVGHCKNCGEVIRGGRRDREGCTRQENPACFRQRTNMRQRKHRAKGC